MGLGVLKRSASVLALSAVLCATVWGMARPAPAPSKEAPWSLLMIPDTQDYVNAPGKLAPLKSLVRWALQESRLRAVIQVGDITDNNLPAEWTRARSAFAPLFARVPLLITTGNHDLGPTGRGETRDTHFDEYFRLEQMPAARVLHRESYGAQLENSLYALEGGEFAVLTLEFGPRDEVLRWARQRLLSPDWATRRVILVTHEYMDEPTRAKSDSYWSRRDNGRTVGNAHHYKLVGSSSNNGSELWRKLIARVSSVELVLSGHYGDHDTEGGVAIAYRRDTRLDGSVVHQVMYNAQWLPSGGDGWSLLLNFDPVAQTIRIRSVSPWLDEGHAPSSRVDAKRIDVTVKRREGW